MRTWTFPSKSKPGTEHTVTVGDAEGIPVCSCPGYERERADGTHGCWHIRDVMIQLNREKKVCPECGGPTFFDGTATKHIPGARVDGQAWARACSLVACSRCEWAQEV